MSLYAGYFAARFLLDPWGYGSGNPFSKDFYIFELITGAVKTGAGAVTTVAGAIISPFDEGRTFKGGLNLAGKGLRQTANGIPVVDDITQGVDDYYNEDISGVYLVCRKNGKDDDPVLLWNPQKGNAALSTTLKDYDKVRLVWLNGQSNDLSDAQNLASNSHVLNKNDGSYILIHNRTSNAIADTFQSLFGKFGTGSKVARQVMQLLKDRATRNIDTYFTVHSQGAIMGTNALNLLHNSGIGTENSNQWKKLKMRYHGSASNESVAKRATKAVGAEWGGMNNHPADFVGNGIGFNGNILTVPFSLLVTPTLGLNSDWWLIGSNHTHYQGINKTARGKGALK